jgi:hypothetical protein
MAYDSAEDTKKHIRQVGVFLDEVNRSLEKRARLHDASKLEEPEKSIFDEFTPKLKTTTYGSDEYKKHLEGMGRALQHHYEANGHHPEHFEDGINGMSLLDIIEMVADWKAATLRHADGDIRKSLEINRKRFGMSDQVYEILKNTVEEMNW